MGSDPEKESIAELRLPLLSIPHTHVRMLSPERTGASTPPSASVPFRWEEEPGKPKPCTALATVPNPDDSAQKCLELPPRMYSSPTTVLEGPYLGRSSRFQSLRAAKQALPITELLEGPYIGRSSRFYSFRTGGECHGSFHATGNSSPEAALPYGALVVSKRAQKDKGIVGFWKRRALKGNREVIGGNYVFPSSMDRESDSSREGEDISGNTTVKITTVRRMNSSPNLSRTKAHFWTSLYEGLKQAVPWRGKRVKKEGFMS